MNGAKAITAIAGLILLVAGQAAAQGSGGHGRGSHGGAREGGRGGYERPPEGRDPGRERYAIGGGYPGREYPPPAPDYGPRGYPPPVYYPVRPERPAPARSLGVSGAWRRGQFLPHNYWGGATLDPRRYRLRSPPPGYGWYAIGPNAYLVQRSTGLILDTAPGVQ